MVLGLNGGGMWHIAVCWLFHWQSSQDLLLILLYTSASNEKLAQNSIRGADQPAVVPLGLWRA
jgi:hypothetical protein